MWCVTGPDVGIPAANTATCLRMLQSSLADVKNIVDGTKIMLIFSQLWSAYYINVLELSERYSTKIGHEYQLPTVSQVCLQFQMEMLCMYTYIIR